MEKILRIVAEYYGVDKAIMTSKKRDGQVMKPRHVAQYFLWKKLGMGFVPISKRFGMKTHVACMKAIKKVEFYEECYEDWTRELKIIENRIDGDKTELSSPYLLEELVVTFMKKFPEQFIESGISERDARVIGDKSDIDIEQIEEIVMGIREKGKKKKEDLLKKQHEDQFNKKKHEPINKLKNEQDTFGV